LAEQVAQELHQLFLVRLQLMLAAVAVEFTTAARPERVALAAVEMVVQLLVATALRHLPTPAVVVAARRQTHRLLTLVGTAALASSSSNTLSQSNLS
jgi:hypothetical protein